MRYTMMRTVSIATLVGGGVLGTVGVVLIATSPRKKQEASLSAAFGVGYIGVEGKFNETRTGNVLGVAGGGLQEPAGTSGSKTRAPVAQAASTPRVPAARRRRAAWAVR